MIKNLVCLLLCMIVPCMSHAEAEEQPEPKDEFVEKFPEEGKVFYPSYFKVNGKLSSIENAPPAYIIKQVSGGYPLVGGHLLPKDRYFSISFEKGSDLGQVNATLGKLGEKLDLKIENREYEGDFLVVRLGEEGLSRKWELGAEETDAVRLGGIENVDEKSEVYRGYNATISEFLEQFAYEDEMPILNRTGFRRGYNFIFERNGEKRDEAIRKAGFSVTKENAKWGCLVISPK